jgi:hypothetical protein
MQKSIVSKLSEGINALVITVGLVALLTLVVACDKRPPASVTKDTLEIRNVAEKIEDFRRLQNQESMNAVDRAFVDLDQEIGELEVYVKENQGMKKQEAESKLSFMKDSRDELHTEFTKAKVSNTAEKVSSDVQNTVNGN